MAKQIYNYELFTHKKEQLLAIQKRRERNRRIKLALLAILVLFLILMGSIIQQSRCDYYYFKEESRTEQNGDVHYETFGQGCIKYSNNGIEYQKNFGESMWNIALDFSKPFVAKNGHYLFLGDRGGNKAILFNESGPIHEHTFKYPLVQLGVAENGTVEVILEGEGFNCIEVYSATGSLIAESRNTLDESGYPITAAISPDGALLAVSYYNVEELKGQTKIAIYDFSKQIQIDTIPLTGGFHYPDELIPRLIFLGQDRLLAMGDHSSYIYDLSGNPDEIKKIDFEEKIESVFVGDDNHFGYICSNDNPDKEGRYHILLYDKKGHLKMESILDMNYDKVVMIGRDLIATKDNECTIINRNGKILFQGVLEGNHIESVLPCPGWRTYRVIFANKITKMKLSFLEKKGTATSTPVDK